MAVFRNTIITLLLLMILFAPNAISQSYSSSWIDGTPYLHEEAQYLLNAIGNNKASLAPPIFAEIQEPAYKIGDLKKFYAINMKNNSQYLLDASLYAVSDQAYIFVEKGKLISSDKIKSLLDSFDEIYSKITNQFGDPPNKVDNDSRIYILVMDIAGGALPNGVRILGYFNPIDQFQNTDLLKWTRKRSNEIDMLYIDSVSFASNAVNIKSVIAHELTHLIQWGKDPEESIWVDEGLAVYAESFMGYNVKDRISAFEQNPDVSLLDWNDTIEDYGAAYLFFAYISERFGGVNTITDIMANELQDTAGIENALAQLGKSISFNDIFSDWVIANYLDDPNVADGKYGYANLDVKLEPSGIETEYPIIQKTGKILAWSAQYIEFINESNKKLKLTSSNQDQEEINIRVIVKAIDGKVDVLSFVNDTTIPSGDTDIIMVVTSQPDPPDANIKNSTYIYSAETEVGSISVNPSGNKIITWGSIKQR